MTDLMTGPSTPYPHDQRGIPKAVRILLMSGRMTSPRTDGEQGRENLRILVAGLRMTCVKRRAEELLIWM
ncbi:hypothetical protein [Paenibacillus polysaccharolyticus]|uniref:hypothetical protein n=1 Tax=Paenibacillus polysaccharolyticus TaxID=582692 RepID=UPI00280C0285|nr:hypothetical protein [Paenibacillus polysaccharolyticus]MDP9701916.1 hypothetical protein [Paenibacillus intestini]